MKNKGFKKIVSLALATILCFGTLGAMNILAIEKAHRPVPLIPEYETPVKIPDKNLQKALNEHLSSFRPEDAIITKEDLGTMSGKLDLRNYGIENLEGLQYCTYVDNIDLYSNKIKDISQLGNLKKLKSLTLANNLISDISPLSNLTNLENLNIFINEITDISCVANMPKLKTFIMEGNQIFDLSPLKSATNLTNLNLGNQSYDGGVVKAKKGDKIVKSNIAINIDGNPVPPQETTVIRYDPNTNEIIFDCEYGNKFITAPYRYAVEINGKSYNYFGYYKLTIDYN